ncbi:MAG: undecaprenyl-diphosphate phosphatase [Bacillota bacterium]
MLILKSIFLGFIQGLTEFLPVSSSGHLVLFSYIVDFPFLGTEGVFFDVALHLGTLLAVLFVLKADIFAMLKSPFGKRTWTLLIATIPAGVLGGVFSSYIESFFDVSCVFVGFYFTAFILLFADSFAKNAVAKRVGYKTAGVMGCMQALALLPGVSRSGSTLLGGVFCGVEKSEVAKFSFLMSVPIILGSALLKGVEISTVGVSSTLVICSVCGGISAFVFGILGIKFFLTLLKKAKLAYFSYYLFALATVVCLLGL